MRIAWVMGTDRAGLELGPFDLQPEWVPLHSVRFVRHQHSQSQVGTIRDKQRERKPVTSDQHILQI